MEIARHFLESAWMLIAEMGPYLLIGFAASALLHRWLKQSWIERLLGGQGLRPIAWGSVVGVPMPLCSCGVIPVTKSLRDKGASRGATVSFLTSTPQTGLDSILATAGMLGPVFAAYKVVVAFVSGIGVALFVEAFSPKGSSSASTSSNPSAPKPNFIPLRPAEPPRTAPQPTWSESLRYGFLTMPGDLASSLFLGFFLAALISAFAPPNLFAQIPGGAVTSVLLITLLAAPFYICAVGSIPLALALVQGGLPLSAALVMLIAGPATSVATIATMRKILGGRATGLYVVGIILCSWIAAFTYEAFFAGAEFSAHAMDHAMELAWWNHAGGIVLLLLLALPFILRRFQPTPTPNALSATPGSKLATIHVAGMTCSHCESSLTEGLRSLPFTESVLSVDRLQGVAVLQGKQFDETSIRQKIESLGFEYRGTNIA